MTLHLLKLCVGIESIAELAEWIEEQQIYARRLRRRLPARRGDTPRHGPGD